MPGKVVMITCIWGDNVSVRPMNHFSRLTTLKPVAGIRFSEVKTSNNVGMFVVIRITLRP